MTRRVANGAVAVLSKTGAAARLPPASRSWICLNCWGVMPIGQVCQPDPRRKSRKGVLDPIANPCRRPRKIGCVKRRERSAPNATDYAMRRALKAVKTPDSDELRALPGG